MPTIQSLHIARFRNLSHVHLRSLGPVNLFWGNNGSGKTSLLEAIYFAGTGRSFRGTSAEHIIEHGKETFHLSATVSTAQSLIPLAIQRGAESSSKSIQWDGKKLSGFAPIAQALPLQFVSALSYRFFSDGPKIRRQFFDWIMFHVKPSFYSSWTQWQRLLIQRNSCLKQRRPRAEVSTWNKLLCVEANRIDEQRQALRLALTPILIQHLQLLSAPFACDLHYDRGWDASETLEAVLNQQIERDYQLGYTSAGPHRADFQLLLGGVPAVNVLSQGQQKLAMYAMHLTQGFFLRQETARSPIYLIDDMASELDPCTQATVLSHLMQELNAQLFLTGITESLFSASLVEKSNLYQIKAGNIFSNQAQTAGSRVGEA